MPWRLAPAFDVNPNIAKAAHVLHIDDSDKRPGLALVASTAAGGRERPAVSLQRPIEAAIGRHVRLFALTALLGVAACSDAPSTKVSQSIGTLVRRPGATELRLADATDFGWDQVHLFEPYAPTGKICATLKLAASDCTRVVSFASTDDGVMSLAFMSAGKVVRYERHLRANGDFTPLPSQSPLARDEAVFRVVPGGLANDGGTWLKLVRM